MIEPASMALNKAAHFPVGLRTGFVIGLETGNDFVTVGRIENLLRRLPVAAETLGCNQSPNSSLVIRNLARARQSKKR
jgi:hypothetical protein